MTWIAELAEIIPPPAVEERIGAADASEWDIAEAELRVRFPEDFKQFLDQWGQQNIADFFGIYSPSSPFSPVRLPGAVLGPAEAYATLKSHHPHYYTLPNFPEPGSLMTCAVTDNGDYIGWIIDPATDPSTWPVAVWGDEDGVPQVFEGMSFGPFMLALVKGEVRPEAFPASVWRHLPMTSEPYEDP